MELGSALIVACVVVYDSWTGAWIGEVEQLELGLEKELDLELGQPEELQATTTRL